jgi:hypothetical protein
VVRWLVKTIAGEVEALPPSLLDRFPELAVVRLRRGGLAPRLGGWCLGKATVAGITFGRTVWLGRGTPASTELLLHELRHVHQFASVRAFPLRYVWESLRRGYHQNRYEVEARQFVAAHAHRPGDITTSEGV